MADDLIARVVNEGWHGLAGIYQEPGMRRIASRMPGMPADMGRFEQLCGQYGALQVSHSQLGGAHTFYAVPITTDPDMVVYHPDDGDARISHSSGFQKKSEWTETLITPARKGFFGTKSAEYGRVLREEIVPAFIDGSAKLVTQGGERAHCYMLDFPDKRWDERPHAVARYAVALRQSLCDELSGAIKNDPSTLLRIYEQAFPEHRAAEGRYGEFPIIENYTLIDVA